MMSFQPLSHRILDAAKTGDTALMRKLFKNHITTNFEDDNGNSALNIAVINNHTDAVKLLIEYGFEVDHQNKQLLTPMHQAVMNCSKDIFLLLYESGANLDIPNHEGYTPIELSEPGSITYKLITAAKQGLLRERYYEVEDVPFIPAYTIPKPKVKSEKSKGKKGKKGKKKKK